MIVMKPNSSMMVVVRRSCAEAHFDLELISKGVVVSVERVFVWRGRRRGEEWGEE